MVCFPEASSKRTKRFSQSCGRVEGKLPCLNLGPHGTPTLISFSIISFFEVCQGCNFGIPDVGIFGQTPTRLSFGDRQSDHPKDSETALVGEHPNKAWTSGRHQGAWG